MPNYEVHFALELPFWLPLPSQHFTIVLGETKHLVRLDNDVVRIDVGDFYRRPEGYLVRWIRESEREAERQRLEAEYPDLPVFQRKTTTVATHIREVAAASDAELMSAFQSRVPLLIDESVGVVNRLLEWYRHVAVDVKRKQEAHNVSERELPSAIVSFWNVTEGMRQVGGSIQPLRQLDTCPPPPVSESEVARLVAGLESGVQPPLVSALIYAAGTMIARGAYRNAIVDAVTALELGLEEAIQQWAQNRSLPEQVIEYLLHHGSFDERCNRLLPALGGPHLPSQKKDLWDDIVTARGKRHAIVHEGAEATLVEALDIGTACIEGVLAFGP